MYTLSPLLFTLHVYPWSSGERGHRDMGDHIGRPRGRLPLLLVRRPIIVIVIVIVAVVVIVGVILPRARS
jgi:hypothetical protein